MNVRRGLLCAAILVEAVALFLLVRISPQMALRIKHNQRRAAEEMRTPWI